MPGRSSSPDAPAGYVIRPGPGADGDAIGGRASLPWIARVVAPAGEEILDEVPVVAAVKGSDGRLRLSGSGALVSAEATWRPVAVAGVAAWEVALSLSALAGPVDGGVLVALHLAPTAEPDWLVPGLFYGSNGPRDGSPAYPRFDRDRPEPAAFVSDRWSFRADRAATPAVFAWDSEGGAALATRPSSTLGPAGIGFAADATATEIGLCFPYREEPVVYDGSPQPGPPDRPPISPWPAATLSFRAYLLPSDRRATTVVLADIRSWLGPKRRRAPRLDPAGAAAVAAEGILRWHYRADPGVLYETAAFDRPADAGAGALPTDRAAMHVAWLSGSPAAHALVEHGRRTGEPATVAAGERVLDAIAANRAPGGTFWGQWTADRGWTKGWTPGPDRLHARTLAEATLFMARATAAADGRGETRQAWRDAVAANLAVAAAGQRADGALGSAIDARTGAVAAWAGTAGLAWVPALVEGGRLLDDPALPDAARRAGRYYAGDVETGRLAGAPEDTGLAPTSEDGYVAVMAYVALVEAETDGDERRRWLRLARASADWMLTFRYTYDVDFPPDSPLGRRGFPTRGADQASPPNQHLHAYGLVCLPELDRLADLVAEPAYRERAAEHLDWALGTLVRDDGDLGGRRGMAAERFLQTNYGGPRGEVGRISHAWCLGLLLFGSEYAVGRPALLEAMRP